MYSEFTRGIQKKEIKYVVCWVFFMLSFYEIIKMKWTVFQIFTMSL